MGGNHSELSFVALAVLLHQILDVVSDLYINPTFPDNEIEKEKGVIIEEINVYQDMPQRIAITEFIKLLYGDQPAGWLTVGPKENIKKMKRTDFIDYRNKQYVASATTVVVAGKINEKEVAKKIIKSFIYKFPINPKYCEILEVERRI